MDENAIEVDDLFGDPNVLADPSMGVTLNNANLQHLGHIQPSLKGLSERLDQLGSSGCCQKVSWSRHGAIAYITKSGYGIKMRCLRYTPNGRRWALSDDFNISEVSEEPSQPRFVHLEWNYVGGDLAAVDEMGRISIFNMAFHAINQITQSRSAASDMESELSQPVGMYWLHQDRRFMMALQSSKENGRWTQVLTGRRPHGPYWPRALAVISKKGQVRLLYHRSDSSWAAVATDLGQFTQGGSLLTHAALASTEENKLLLVTHTLDRKLWVYQISIAFPEPSAVEIVPQMSIERLKGNFSTASVNTASMANDLLNGISSQEESAVRLTALQIVPTTDIDKAIQLPPMILAAYTSIDSSFTSPIACQPTSTISRWNVTPVERKLHPRFEEISHKQASINLAPKMDVQRLPDTLLMHAVTAVHQVDGGSAIAVTTHDGTTALYNPNTMEQLYMETNINEVTSMSQSGWTMPITTSPLHMALSVNGCAAASFSKDGKLEFMTMEYHSGLPLDPSVATQDTGIDTAIASLSLAFARACYSTSSSDDILLSAKAALDLDQQLQLRLSMYQSLFRDTELLPGSPDADKIPRNQMVAKLLSFQTALTNGSGDDKTRNTASSFAWMTLNIRYVAMQAYSVLATVKFPHSDYSEPDMLSTICNNVVWGLDLFKLMLGDLFETSEALERQRLSNGNTVQLPSVTLTTVLLTANWSRFFLRTISRCFRGMLAHGANPQPTAEPEWRHALQRLARTVESGKLPIQAIERVLDGADKIVLATYADAGFGDRDRADTERTILATGQVQGTVLSEVIPRLCEDVLPTTRNEIDRLALHLGDYDWVHLDASAPQTSFEEGWNSGVSWSKLKGHSRRDVHRKQPIKNSSNSVIRRCARCGSENVDINGPPRNWPKYSMQQALRCVCESAFLVEE